MPAESKALWALYTEVPRGRGCSLHRPLPPFRPLALKSQRCKEEVRDAPLPLSPPSQTVALSSLFSRESREPRAGSPGMIRASVPVQGGPSLQRFPARVAGQRAGKHGPGAPRSPGVGRKEKSKRGRSAAVVAIGETREAKRVERGRVGTAEDSGEQPAPERLTASPGGRARW